MVPEAEGKIVEKGAAGGIQSPGAAGPSARQCSESDKASPAECLTGTSADIGGSPHEDTQVRNA